MNKDRNDNENENDVMIMAPMLVVSGLGFSFIVLAFLRVMDIEIPTELILGVSVSSLIFVLFDFFYTANRSSKKIRGIHPLIMILSNFLAIASLICLPYLPFIKNMSPEYLSRISDSVSLLAFGTTISLIGFKGAEGFVAVLRRNNKVMNDSTEKIELLLQKYDSNNTPEKDVSKNA